LRGLVAALLVVVIIITIIIIIIIMMIFILLFGMCCFFLRLLLLMIFSLVVVVVVVVMVMTTASFYRPWLGVASINFHNSKIPFEDGRGNVVTSLPQGLGRHEQGLDAPDPKGTNFTTFQLRMFTTRTRLWMVVLVVVLLLLGAVTGWIVRTMVTTSTSTIAISIAFTAAMARTLFEQFEQSQGIGGILEYGNVLL